MISKKQLQIQPKYYQKQFSYLQDFFFYSDSPQG